MEWDTVLDTKPGDVEEDKALLEDIYNFITRANLPDSIEEAPSQLQEKDALFKVLHIMCGVVREKGLDALAAEEELKDMHTQLKSSAAHMGTTEPELVEQLSHLERKLREKDEMIDRLRHQVGTASPTTTNRQIRHWKEELEDVTHELTELKRSLGQERIENQRLMKSASTERVKARQLEREMESLRHNIDDYRKQLEWQREQVGGAGGWGTVEADCKERLRKKDLEMADQLDKIEELLNGRDDLEEQLREAMVQIRHVEEQKLVALKDTEAMKSALVGSDVRCDELETQNRLLEGKVIDLQEQLTHQNVADDHIAHLVHTRAQEWEEVLASKDAELVKCREKVEGLQGQLSALERHSNHAMSIKLKKELQSREAELLTVQKELSDATSHITNLSSQLDQFQDKDTCLINSALKQELERAQHTVKTLENDLVSEVNRREQSEAEKEERDKELTQAITRLGEYERGEYGLHEAVTEIKVKKEELAVRDKDISELTQHVNQLESELNHFSEENEVLREKLGMGVEESVDVSIVRRRRDAEQERLHKENRMLHNEVERLEEDKLNLRKQLLSHAVIKRSHAHHLDHVDTGLPSHAHSLVEEESKLREAWREEKRERESLQSEVELLKGRLTQTQEKLNQMKVIVMEMKDGKKTHNFKSEALNRLIALLEVEGSGSDMALVLQLKTQLSELVGQNEVLSQQVQQSEAESRQALRELERKQCALESLNKELSNLRKMQSGFQPIPLPQGISASSNEVIASLNEQLLHTLNQLHSREDALGEARDALERLQRKFAVIIHQQGVLYLEYKESRTKWEKESGCGREERERLLMEREEDKIKTQELELLQASLAGGDDEIRKRLGEMSRKLTLLQVNDNVLSRKQQLLQEREAGLRKENSQLHHDKVWIEKAVTEKIAYLQRHKETVLFKLSSLQQQLSESVSVADMDKANQQYNQLAIKYQQLLSQQTAYTATTANVDQLQAEVRTLDHQLHEVKHELALEKHKSGMIKASDSMAEKGLTGEGQGQMATMEMQVLNEKQRAELANARWQQVQGVVAQLEQRNVTLEEKFSELTQRLLQAQACEADLRDQLACSLPQAEKGLLEQTNAQLKKSEAQLRIDNSHLKEVADIARQQAVAMEMVQKSHDLEVTSLRQQLLDLQGASDERTTVGRLHHQLLSLQVSEASALKKLEEAEAKILKLEVNLLQAEQQRLRESEAVFQCRAEAASRVKHLRATIQSLRRQYSGAIPLSECERTVNLIQKARDDRRKAAELMQEAKKDMMEAQGKLLSLEAQQANLEELIAALHDSTPGSSTARMTEWHAKLGELRLVELRLTRTNQQLNERVKHLEEVVSTSEKSFAKLEQELVIVTKDFEASQLSWEQREAQLEKQLEAWSRTKMDQDTHVSLESSGQLQDTLLQLRETSKEKALVAQQLDQREKELRHLEIAMSQVRRELLEKENEVVKVREEMEKTWKANQGGSIGKEDPQAELELRLSLESNRRLKAELSAKEELAEKYQQMLQDIRKEHQVEVSALKEEAATLRLKLNTQADSAFSRLKQVAMEAATISTPEGPTDAQLERLLKLEDLTIQQQQEVNRLRQEVDAKRQERDSCELSYEARITKIKMESKELALRYKQEMEELRASLADKSARVIELEQEVEVFEGELSAAQQAAKQAPSRTMKALVDRLRNQLSVKEQQQRALSQALLQVRADLVEAAQKTLEGEVGKDQVDTNIQHLVNQKTQELNQQVLYLSGRLDEVKGQLSEHASQETKNLEELERVKGELEKRGTFSKTMEAELLRKGKLLEQARVREDKLIHKLQHLQSEIENSPLVLELQKRVKVLQGKVDKQKDHIKTMEESMKVQHPSGATAERERGAKGGKTTEGVFTTDKTCAVSSKHQAVEVMRWEEGKKWQKKLDTVRTKLTEKSEKLETIQKQITSLRDLQSRSDREKSILNAKVKALQRQLTEDNLRPVPNKEERSVDGHSVGELERVVSSMKKVIEKLQGENESLKRSAASSRPAQGRTEEGKRIISLQEENNKLKRELQDLQRSTGPKHSATSKSPYDKIVAENERLAKDYKREVAKTERLQLALTTLEIQRDKLAQEVERFSSRPPGVPPSSPKKATPGPQLGHQGSEGHGGLEVKVEQLQAEVEKKTSMLLEVKKHLKEAAKREMELKALSSDAQLSEKYLAVVQERDTFKQEIAQLRKELDAFDPSFFEEIEDLKFNYQQSVKRNVELEDQLSQLTSQQGTSITDTDH